MVRSFENFLPSAVDNLPQKKFFDILKPKPQTQHGTSSPPAGSSYPFTINMEYKNNLAMIRHHVTQRVGVGTPVLSSNREDPDNS
jgi:hypothetical protein